LYWSVRRELWENRSIYMAPLAVAGVILLGFLIATLGRALSVRDLAMRRAVLEEPYSFASLVLMATTLIVAIFYCLDALHGERRDRSILFWKSLPVSDAHTVLVKFAVGMVIVPFAVFILTMLAYGLIYGALSLGVPAFSSFTAATVHGSWWDALLSMLGMLVASLLWYAPVGAWFMVASVASRRAPILTLFMPFVALGIAEGILFQTKHVWQFLGYRLTPQKDLMEALAEPNLWLGLVAAAGMLYLVIRLRRYRDDT